MTDIHNGEAGEAKEQLVKVAQRAAVLEILLVAVAAAAVVIAVATTIWVSLGNRANQERIRDCTEPTGQCYQNNQKATAEAVQTILDYIDDTIEPFRAANAAFNRCQVELFAGRPTVLDKGAGPALTAYEDCIARNADGTASPDPPQNPLTTTTTTGKKGSG